MPDNLDFGLRGDPTNVTVFGESAGGFSIGALLAMPAAAGLFDKAILQSGATSRTFPRESATQMARDFLAKLGLTHPDELLTVPVERILDVQEASPQPTKIMKLTITFPIIYNKKRNSPSYYKPEK